MRPVKYYKSVVNYEVGDIVVIHNPKLLTDGYNGKVVQLLDTSAVIYLFALQKEMTYKYSNFILEKENKVMQRKNLPTGYNRVAVINRGYKPYYYALYDEDVKVGSKVLVTGLNQGEILTVDDVIEASEAIKNLPHKEFAIREEVCAVIDDSAYRTRVEKREKLVELKRQMDEMIAKEDAVSKYARYAEQNPEIAELFRQFQELSK